ncbi:hypothetical protein K5A21_002864 [Listeria innocua]|uniref:hypothetical protein n=1 Tax=Listeria monocytogenes TaxID=1639 RepID=UPI0010E0B5C0|nr:hypothetical protein [Listeria monocytogenes]EHY9151212.1 hypothetical protein [Listeria innocua]EAE3853765.1 hypothetical protein [Listeria monocytogenes]EAF4778795.1 hypothetical protein [Listeria monocytogenes]EAG8398262.1 hypothetical protein [Listeria monocytogenes]EGC2924547.1 hypothetical protein [Listeria monocytogenes]
MIGVLFIKRLKKKHYNESTIVVGIPKDYQRGTSQRIIWSQLNSVHRYKANQSNVGRVLEGEMIVTANSYWMEEKQALAIGIELGSQDITEDQFELVKQFSINMELESVEFDPNRATDKANVTNREIHGTLLSLRRNKAWDS